MKYQFKIPFNNISGPGITNGYVVSHSIFLSDKERYALSETDTAIETVSPCVSVRVEKGITDEPGQEIFCYYKIITAKSPSKIVLPIKTGWWIHLNKDQSIKLNDCKYLAMVNHDIVIVNSSAYPIIHQIVISDIVDLECSMYCCHLPQTVSK